jgi:riboflavin transporter FmnP
MTENNVQTLQQKNRSRIRWITKTGILAAVATALMYLEFSVPLMPAFLEFDFSEVPVLIAAFSMGPLTGILIELIKNLIHLPAGGTSGIGELANFLVGSAFVGVAGMIYQQFKTRGGAFISMLFGTLAMVVMACFANYFITIPFYFRAFGLNVDSLIGASAAVGNTLVRSMNTFILYAIIPFNLFKGIVVSLVVAVIYKRISPLLHR